MKSRHMKKVDQRSVDRSVNYYNTVPCSEVVSIVMDERNTFKNFKLSVKNAKMYIKNNCKQLKDIQLGLNKIYMEVVFNVYHERNINFTKVSANIEITVKLDSDHLLVIKFDSSAEGVSAVNKSDLLMEYALIFGKGFLRNINFSFVQNDFTKEFKYALIFGKGSLHNINFSFVQNDFTKEFKSIIDKHFPVNLTELESIRKRDNYDGYKSYFSNINNVDFGNLKKGDVFEKL